MAACSIRDCVKPAYCRSLCQMHYTRLLRRGTTDRVRPDLKGFIEEAVAEHDSDDCLLWPFGKNRRGYGIISPEGAPRIASRIVCERYHGDPPTPQHQAAHSCGNTSCVNPRHIRWATRSENERDKILHGTFWRGARLRKSQKEQDDGIRTT